MKACVCAYASFVYLCGVCGVVYVQSMYSYDMCHVVYVSFVSLSVTCEVVDVRGGKDIVYCDIQKRACNFTSHLIEQNFGRRYGKKNIRGW